jgi:all-trans-retinol 13,14-reductase
VWEHTTIGKRGDSYLKFKQEKSEKLLDVMAIKFPEIRNCIQTYYSSTPLTYRDYTGIPEGAMYGIQKDCNNHLNSFMTPRTKIPNLFLTGQNIQLHGILGVAMCALHTCSVFIDYNKLIAEIRNV